MAGKSPLQAIYDRIGEQARVLEESYPTGGEICVRLFRVRGGGWEARISPKPPEIRVAPRTDPA